MSADRKSFHGCSSEILLAAPSAAKVFREGSFFDPSMNPSLLEGFDGGGLGMAESWLGAAFGECPAFALAGLDQQELDSAVADPVANRSDFFALATLAKL